MNIGMAVGAESLVGADRLLLALMLEMAGFAGLLREIGSGEEVRVGVLRDVLMAAYAGLAGDGDEGAGVAGLALHRERAVGVGDGADRPEGGKRRAHHARRFGHRRIGGGKRLAVRRRCPID